MNVSYCPTVGEEFRSTLISFDDDPGVEGLFVLATPDEALRPEAIDETLCGLSTPVFGGLFPELLVDGESYDEGAVVVGLSVRPTVTTITSADAAELAAVDPSGYETAFVFVDAYADDGEAVIERLFNSFGVGYTYLGGGAGSLSGERPSLITNEGITDDTAVVALIEPESSIGVEHGWTEIGGPFEITAADGRTVETLDGRPAYELYAEVIERETEWTVDRERFFEVAKSHPFGISRLNAERIVRDPFEVTDDDGLVCFGELPEGEFVHILEGDPDTLISAAGRAHETATDAAASPAALVTFDCISRAQYLDSAFDRELAAISKGGETVGALTIGEIANDGKGHLDYYNKTAVVGALEEL